jgi:beta-alanine degradation protein BauB
MKDTMPYPLRMMIAALVLSAGLPDLGRAGDTSANVPVTEMKFFDTGIGPLKAAPGFGDFSKGAHSTFIKLPANFATPSHFYTEDLYGVVISGVVANAVDASVTDVPLAPGSYWFQKGKAAHVTKCLSANECVLFITQPGKFDFVKSN